MSIGIEEYAHPVILILLAILDQAVQSFPEIEIVTKLFLIISLGLQTIYFYLKIRNIDSEKDKNKKRSTDES